MRRIYLGIAFVAMASAASAQQLSMSDMMQLRQDCGADIARLCPGITPGGGRLIECVRDKKDRLSKSCTDTMGKVMASQKKN
ncbi:MAG: cysteine rich repeat-containing protein [Neorhizobium sp.]|nr:cysteine rich repeat-containing protein [Neorhizobium sp.]